MTKMINKWIGIGRLGSDPECKYGKDGNAVTTFSIATSESWKDKAGEKQERTEWTNCVAFSRLGEVCAEYLHKGDLIYVEGTKNTSAYDKEVGGETIKMYSVSVRVMIMKMLGGKGEPTDKPDEPDGW